jgi:DNA-binding response OmpR family regulator
LKQKVNPSFLAAFYKTFTTPQSPAGTLPLALGLDLQKEGLMGLLQEGTKPTPSYGDEHLSVDFLLQVATLDSQRMILTRKEYELLALLVEHAGQIIPREALLKNVWGYGAEIRTRTLDVHIRRLRKKLGVYAEQYIETIFGIGYRFQPFHAPRFLRSPQGKPLFAVSA